MPSQFEHLLKEGFVPPGSIRVSSSALKLARDLNDTIGKTQRGDWVIAFDWSTNVNVRRSPNEPSEPVADCVMLGAFKRDEVPADAIQLIEGLEIVFLIPQTIWVPASERLIDTDESLLFKLVLR